MGEVIVGIRGKANGTFPAERRLARLSHHATGEGMRIVRKLVAICAAVVAASPAVAESPAEWAALTERDVEAAYRLLNEDHPALSAEIDDRAFRARIDAARTLALSRAKQVTADGGYLATLSALAVAAGDKHIWSRAHTPAAAVDWAGVIVSRRGNRYIVVEHDAPAGPSLKGATLLGCDGIDVDRLAETRLGGFRAVWSIEAQRIQSAPLLLVDFANPFAPRPNICTFDAGGARRDVTLAWRPIKRDELRPRVAPALNRGAAGFGVRSFAGGKWIALQSLGDRAPAVVQEVRAQADALRAAPVVVLDMRGNGGGNSAFGDQIATVLFGDARFGALQGDPLTRGCNTVWRISPRNLATMRQYRERFRDSAPDFAREIDRQLSASEGRASGFTGPINCDRTAVPGAVPAQLPPPAAKGRIVVLTDNACFSSCLLVTDRLRKLGALHVGQATDAGTAYFEVREDLLPSGRSYFSTLQAFSPSSPREIGPFAPAVAYDGEIADTKALEAWIAAIASAQP